MILIPLIYNIRSIAVRRISTLLTVGGIALATGIYVIVLMLIHGLDHAMERTGSVDNAIVLRRGATSETLSNLQRDWADVIEVAPEIAPGPDGAPLVVSESVVGVNLPRRGAEDDRQGSNVTVRGITGMSMALREGVTIVEGRALIPGNAEILAGVNAARGFRNCEVGGSIHMGGIDWTVVGVFTAGGSAYESELWGDRDLLMGAFGRRGFSSVTLRMREPRLDGAALQGRFDADPRVDVHVQTEQEYFTSSSLQLRVLISMLGGVLITLFSAGAVMGAMVTMFAFVGTRTREIGTLRALGFTRRAILTCFVVESMMLALAGGIVAVVPALFVQQFTFSTTNFATFTDVTWHFRASPTILGYGLIFSMVVGLLGGILPACRAATLPIIASLREV